MAVVYRDIKVIASLMGRTEDSITSRMVRMLRLPYCTSNEELIKLFLKQFTNGDPQMDDLPESKGPAKYRIVLDNKTRAVAETAEEAEAKATAFLRASPMKDVFIYVAIKRLFVPTTISMEDVP
jgi:hypothetical protein